MSIKGFYRKNFLLLELAESIFFILLLIGLLTFFKESIQIESWIRSINTDFFSLLATITGTLLGFVIAGVAILLAFPSSERLEELKRSQHYKTIYELV